jgi:hypothetical protein
MYKVSLWLLKLGSIINLYFFGQTLIPPLECVNNHLLIPAQILFIVSAYRCFFPVNYGTNAVLHDSFLSSIFLTRLLATFVEVLYIYQFSYLIRLFNAGQIPLADLLSWLMVIQVIISQYFVWGAILTQKQILYFYEEMGWGIIFILYTIASAMLYCKLDNLGGRELLLQLNLLFGILYLPWQCIHLKSICLRIKDEKVNENLHKSITWNLLKQGLYRSILVKNHTVKPKDWGGVVGMTWMFAYWATLIPAWLFLIIRMA